jgi:hypothetical protein
MYKFLVANGQRLAFGLGILITAIFLFSVIGGLEQYNELPEEDQITTSIFNAGISGAVILIIVAAAALILFGLFQVLSNLKASLKGILGLAVLLVVFFIAYSSANGDAAAEITPISNSIERVGGIAPGNLKFIGGAIVTAMVLIGTAFASFILAEIINFFK